MTLVVFVSHSEDDNQLFSRLKDMCKGKNIDLLQVEHTVEPGLPLSVKIHSLIESSDIFLVIWSENSRKSIWVNQEISIARSQEIRIIPFKQAGIKTEALLQGLKYIEYDLKDPEHGLKKLRDSLIEYMKAFTQRRNRLQKYFLS